MALNAFDSFLADAQCLIIFYVVFGITRAISSGIVFSLNHVKWF